MRVLQVAKQQKRLRFWPIKKQKNFLTFYLQRAKKYHQELTLNHPKNNTPPLFDAQISTSIAKTIAPTKIPLRPTSPFLSLSRSQPNKNVEFSVKIKA